MEGSRARFWPLAATMVKMNLRTAAEYRASFIAQAVFMLLNNSIYLLFWWIFFSRFESVGDWNLPDLVTLFAVSAFAFGLATTFFGNCTRLSHIIVTGGVDSYLTLPRDPLLHILMGRMSPAAVGDMVFALVILLALSPVPLSRLPLFLVLAILAAVVFVSFGVIAHSLSFFLGSAEGFGSLLHNALMTFSLYPETIFGGWIHTMLFTIVPAGFMSYLPVRLLREPSLLGILGLAVAACLWALAAWLVFRAGLRRYESGNLMGPRQ